MEKVINVRNIKFVLKSNGRLYASGNGYLSSTVNSEKILLSGDTEKEIEMCLKNIEYNSAGNCVSLYDTRDQGYDIFIHDNFAYSLLSFSQSETGKHFGKIVGGVIVMLSVTCLLSTFYRN